MKKELLKLIKNIWYTYKYITNISQNLIKTYKSYNFVY